MIHGAVFAGDTRVKLIPDLHAGQTITYLIRYRSDKNVKTESNVVAPMAPNAAQLDAHGLLQVDVLDVKQEGGKALLDTAQRYPGAAVAVEVLYTGRDPFTQQTTTTFAVPPTTIPCTPKP